MPEQPAGDLIDRFPLAAALSGKSLEKASRMRMRQGGGRDATPPVLQRKPQRDRSVSAVMLSRTLRVTPPNSISHQREWP